MVIESVRGFSLCDCVGQRDDQHAQYGLQCVHFWCGEKHSKEGEDEHAK